MQYRLRSLVTLTAVAPPLLAALWFFGQQIVALAGCFVFMGLWVVWYAMVVQAQNDPKRRGYGNYSE
jgi:hypothetical protein